MICVSLRDKTYEEIIEILERQDIEMAEIRLDLCQLKEEEIQDLFANSDTPLIASGGSLKALKLAIESGARFADLALDAPATVSRDIQKLCTRCGTELIRSYHDFNGTPDEEDLQRILARAFRYGADIVKIVTTAVDPKDCKRVQSLYSVVLEGIDSLEGKLIAFAMGDKGRESRVECLRRGAPFTYAALSDSEPTAPGQLNLEEMRKAVYGTMRPYIREDVTMPASKSFAQRAILAAALAEGTSVLHAYSRCADSEAAILLAESLGAAVERKEDSLVITGTGGKILPSDSFHAGESGLLARLAIPVLSALSGKEFTITGEKTLLQRPLSGAVNIMASFGVILSGEKVPVRVKGTLIPGNADVSGKDGSQLISGLLMALPLCDQGSNLFVGEPKSIPYMYITQDVLGRFGVKISCEMEGDAELLEMGDWSCCSGMSFKIPGGQRYKACELTLESDWSSAANFLVAGALFGSVSIAGLDSSSIQADLTIMDILVDAGAVVSEMEDGTICVRKAPLEGFSADMNHCPDLFPIVSVLAAFCAGESRLEGIARLFGKESNRAEAILEMLRQMGVEAEIEENVLVIQGESLSARLLRGHLLLGGNYSSRHDHRMAMALKVASLAAKSPIVIDDEACIEKSFPEFGEKFANC